MGDVEEAMRIGVREAMATAIGDYQEMHRSEWVLAEVAVRKRLAPPPPGLSAARSAAKSSDHGDEALRAAAKKMRHSTKMQSSAAYDRSNQQAQTAVVTAARYSAKFCA